MWLFCWPFLQVGDGLNPVPTSPQEIEDCSLVLTPKQLHQIFIGKISPSFKHNKGQKSCIGLKMVTVKKGTYHAILIYFMFVCIDREIELQLYQC